MDRNTGQILVERKKNVDEVGDWCFFTEYYYALSLSLPFSFFLSLSLHYTVLLETMHRRQPVYGSSSSS
jgi:hypothetical protein